jgi:hypothetical protein
MAMVNVPREFKPHHPFEYPTNNHTTFEEWFADQPIPETERKYLPVFWTSYYCKHQYGKNKKKMQDLQVFINSLREKYWTIVQYDDSIINKLTHLDVKIYGMGGGRIDYPLPLICQPHPYKFEVERNIFASFYGANNHQIRKDLFLLYGVKGNYLISSIKVPISKYCETMARSIFALCPRGYGQSSFRICEALQYGAIPVYISDHFIIPFNKDFNEYGVTIHIDQVHNLDKILSDIPLCDIYKKREAGKKAYAEMFTYEGCYKQIIETL